MKAIRQSAIRLLVLGILLSAYSAHISAVDICVSDKLKVGAVHGRVIVLWNVGPESPIPNAAVELRREKNDEWQTVAQTTTDAAGRFDMKDLRPGKYEIFVKAENFRSWGTRLQVVKGSKSEMLGKEIVVALTPYMGEGHCSDGRVEKVKSR